MLQPAKIVKSRDLATRRVWEFLEGALWQ